ncbi:hypothetical protein PLESTB_000561100 [Pleodorina starrii]|uniref:Uncharacterized protein n=1 Tax=Pleodorina starrii TaxID=330485 RepID=A0A9W6BGU8_9CHLO|nr:hypothetical protein PLESTB_000561100 [Pleodorina starrii]GLC74583.1 hypothetical protein PLESTF_001529900 [Pleodorina starrii]
MVVATVRVSELLTKNADKVVSFTSSKPASGLILNAPTSNEVKLAAGTPVSSQSRSVSPSTRAAFSWSSTRRLEETGTVQQEDEDTQGNEREPELNGDGRRASMPLTINMELQSCPSFGEQSRKPLWIDRHYTLQRAYSDALRSRGDDDDSDAEDGLGRVDKNNGSDEALDSKGVADGLEKYLPTWEIAKSRVWKLAEAALQHQSQVQAAAAARQSSSSSHPSAGTRSELETVAEEDLDPTTTTTITAAATPFVCAVDEDDAAADPAACHFPPLLTHRHTAPPPLQSPPPSPPPPPPASLQSFGSALRRARSMGRAAFSNIPLGLGRALASSPASSFGTGRAACSASTSRAGGGSVDGNAELHTHGGSHHVAFAAGLAAATSATAAVSQAAGVAAAGLSAATSLGSAASLVLELGSKALSAGGGVLVDRVQNIAARHATAAVTELVLGPSASPAARDVLVNRVQATVAGASIAWFLLNLAAMSDSLTHLDFEHDFVTSVKVVLDLATSGPSLMESCKELMQIGVAVGLRVAHRNAGGGMGGVTGGFDG